MKITTVLVTVFALLGAGIDSASARCFTTGLRWADKERAIYHANRACKGYDGNRGAFQGQFAAGEVKNACVDYNPDQHFRFSITNRNNNAAFDLGDEDCAFRLTQVIEDCDRGGRNENSGWSFLADPNAGKC